MSSLAFAYVEVPVKNLLKLVNPFENPPWYCRSFTTEEVNQAIEEGRFQEEPVHNWYSIEDQIERIAYLVVEGWDLDKDVPHIDVGVPEIGGAVPEWLLEDGNHRFCAAVVRGDNNFRVVISGSLDYAEELLGIKIPSPDRCCED